MIAISLSLKSNPILLLRHLRIGFLFRFSVLGRDGREQGRRGQQQTKSCFELSREPLGRYAVLQNKVSSGRPLVSVLFLISLL